MENGAIGLASSNRVRPRLYQTCHAGAGGPPVRFRSIAVLAMEWGSSPKPIEVKINPSIDTKTPPKIQVDTMPAGKYRAYAAELLKLHPAHLHRGPWSWPDVGGHFRSRTAAAGSVTEVDGGTQKHVVAAARATRRLKEKASRLGKRLSD